MSSTASWPALSEEHPLLKLHARLPTILESAQHSRIWCVQLASSSPPPFDTLLILQKYLRSNANDLDKAEEALTKTLKWRREFGLDQEGEKAKEGVDGEEFKGLGVITEVGDAVEGSKVVTWNLYGVVKDKEATFGDVDRFLRWRVNLMERAIALLDLPSATTPIPDHGAGPDPYQMIQIHDYNNVSFLRMDPTIKKASGAVIELFSHNYPELLSRKFFVSVPFIMSWVFQAISLLLSKETTRKFVVLSYKTNLAKELGGNLEDIPVEYGGKGQPLIA
ncbi:phosphatidylinositol transfer protein SFH5 [Leucosporidium creatinivorum]|uniref:Phosphatidylinositol transfer protein SFH5 n=1 Tax=Leucosporidium creatinivorum TaxID=106004 RepID=A0A1Y2DU82_9BASI|nr:phosphatidylinositol transfer protein SFH5 [Leucosporidium creatinivorum]